MSRVLVVDDEPQIRRALRTSLEAHGYEVVAVGTGEEGVLSAADVAPDLLLLDLGLPDIDGTEVIRRVRACFKGSDAEFAGIASAIEHVFGLCKTRVRYLEPDERQGIVADYAVRAAKAGGASYRR